MAQLTNRKVTKRGATPRASLSEQAYEEIKWRIIADELPSGILFTENDICDTIGFGKAPIRAALMELKHDRLIDVVPRKGFFVRPWSSEEAAQLMFIRRLIEPELAAMAALNADEPALQALKKTVAAAADFAQSNNRRALVQTDNELHVTIARISGVEVGAEVVEMLKLRSHFLWHVSISGRAQLEAVQAQHERILDAILASNPDAARTAMREHLTQLESEKEST